MTPFEFDELARLVQTRTGVILQDAKRELAEANLWEVRRRRNLPPLGDLLRRVREGDEALAGEIVDALLVCETLFFRDGKPFLEFFRDMLPSLHKARLPGERLRVWSAAAASGQEAYSLAILVKESRVQLGGRPVDILATDVSTTMIARGRGARYSAFEVQRGVSALRLVSHFDRDGNDWVVKPEIAGLVRFEPFNLIGDFSGLPLFDVIFCRNVMLYFDDATRRALLAKLASRLRPDGYLVLGGAESPYGLTDGFASAGPGAASYQRVPIGQGARLSA